MYYVDSLQRTLGWGKGTVWISTEGILKLSRTKGGERGRERMRERKKERLAGESPEFPKAIFLNLGNVGNSGPPFKVAKGWKTLH